MSLTSFVQIPEIRDEMKKYIRRPAFDYVPLGNVIIPAHDRYALMGTAFDYALRVLISAKFPKAQQGLFVAQMSIMFAKSRGLASKEVVGNMINIVDQALRSFQERKINENFCQACLNMANLDTIMRTGVLPKNIPYHGRAAEVLDLRELCKRALEMFPFPKQEAILNPTFGLGSEMVDGGDADLILDGTLIEIKTTKFLKLDMNYIRQLVGYLVLKEINSGVVVPGERCQINSLGIYYSRQGVFASWQTEEIIEARGVADLAKFFSDYVNEHNNEIDDLIIDGNDRYGSI